VCVCVCVRACVFLLAAQELSVTMCLSENFGTFAKCSVVTAQPNSAMYQQTPSSVDSTTAAVVPTFDPENIWLLVEAVGMAAMTATTHTA